MAEVRASHILVPTEEQAKELKEQIDNGGDFGVLAKAHSKCPSGNKGGDLGWFRRGMMVKEFDTACFSMKEGEVSGPIKTQFGWHIIKLTGKR
ncbi:peptidylprolyl isomerase [Candidatus Woesearchaeota archaeon CG11_big_fil_rev_8_21_14_0_20_43_8]|nr:MAG: peptidylprolyl isomerase [Candidatus Woesearchaeota archaeon CG11_big_fil_rev_8_21_14_0_20_43_8]